MTRVRLKALLKSVGLIAVIVLVPALLAGILNGPARAQEPKIEPRYIDLQSPTTPKREPEVAYEVLPAEEGLQAEPQAAGYLRVVVVDGFSGRAMPGLRFSVYDRSSAVVAELYSDCSGAAQLDGLPTGYYYVQPQYADGDRYIAYGGSYSQWLFVGAGRSATIRFYSYPAIRLAGIRAYTFAYEAYYTYYRRTHLAGIPVSVYDYSGALVFSGRTNCSGFEDFFEAQPGWYRVAVTAGQGPTETPAPATATPPAPGTRPSSHYNPAEVWVYVYPGYLVAIDFYLDPSAYPQATATTPADATATMTPGTGTPTATPSTPTNTPSPTPTATPTQQSGPPPPPPPP